MGFLEDLFGRLSPQRPPVDVFGGVEPLDAFGDLMGDGSDALPPITPFGGLDRSFGGFGGGLGSTTSSSPAFWQMPALGGGIGTTRRGAFSQPLPIESQPLALPSRRAFSAKPAATTGTTTTGSTDTYGVPNVSADVTRWYPLAKKYADQEGVPVEAIMAIIQNESGGQPGARSGVNPGDQGRAVGLMQLIPKYHGQDGADLTDPEINIQRGVRYFAQAYKKRGNDLNKAMAEFFGGGGAFDSAGNIRPDVGDINITIGKYLPKFQATTAAYKTWLDRQGQTATGQGAIASPAGLTPDQFNMGLSTADAMSACGPAAAIAFARSMGRNPTPQEAVALARQVGWNPQTGMAGPQSQVALLKQMGIGATMTQGVDWERVKTEAAAGRPVIIDSPAHYFVVEGYDPATNRFNFGNSAARALRKAGGNAWWRPEDLGNLIDGGTPRSAIYLGTA